ncbi:MAG: hypothetical protein OXM55_06850 [Bdellovibrionales bacterium]|nr:hypothetical protein [Bdellovibrionales bacterium]
MSKSTISPANEIWSLIRETQRNLKRFSAEAERRQAEAEKQRAEENRQQAKRWAEAEKQRAEEKKQQAKRWAEADRRKAEIDQIIKDLSAENKKVNEGLKKAKELFETQWGKLMESLVEGDLVKVLNERGIDVKHTYMNIKREHGEDRYEYDIVAGNGDEAVVVEVKTTLKVQHIKYFLEGLKKFSDRLSSYRGKVIYGAVAYLRADESASKYAERQGLFVIKATGNSAYLINKEGFEPKVFS